MTPFLLVIVVFLTVPLVFAGIFNTVKPKITGDIEDSEEDGYFRRFPGGVIEYFRHEYDVHKVLMSPPVFTGDGLVEFDVKEVWGVRKSLIYRIPIFHDPLPVYDYY
ncbi:MAG: hypothetical protein IH594_16295, partial [Bacteroidales bacterium]|nr:hypothetical protein [Bacteroidales bacterium]